MIRNIKRVLVIILSISLIVYRFYPEEKLKPNTKIDKIIVYKSDNRMYVYSKGKLQKVYKISIGRNSIGKKEVEGDKKTPEGKYIINDKNPNSSYYKNLGISYPNQDNLSHAKRLGKSAGGEIKIHGLRNYFGCIGKFHRLFNWTLGCIALTNWEMEELYQAVEIGTEIEIKP